MFNIEYLGCVVTISTWIFVEWYFVWLNGERQYSTDENLNFKQQLHDQISGHVLLYPDTFSTKKTELIKHVFVWQITN